MSRKETEIIRETKASLKAHMKEYYKRDKIVDIDVVLDPHNENSTFGTLLQ